MRQTFIKGLVIAPILLLLAVAGAYAVCPAVSIESSLAYASLTGTTASSSSLYSINLSSGAATAIGTIGTSGTVRGIAINPGGDIYAIDGLGTTLLSFPRKTPGTITSSAALSGLQAGESILAIDFRPANGALYGLGSTSRLYSIIPSTGEATAVGSVPFSPALSGTEFGFDFNPMVDRIRIVSNAGQNFRLNPDTGTVAGSDTNLNGAATTAVGSAYTNDYAGAPATTLYAIDAATDSLYIQSNPNGGMLVLVGPLGFNTDGRVGFDISNPLIFPDAVADGSYSETLTGAGGTGPYTFLVTAGALPPGMSLSSAGVLGGTPTATGSFTFTITTTDANGCSFSQQYKLNVLRRPSNLVATATSTTSVSLTWSSGAVDHFEVWRNSGSGFVFRATSFVASYGEAVSPGAAYAYKVRSVDADGHFSEFSDADVATTITFTDDPLVVQTTIIKAIHITQLRQAINLVRGLTPLGAFSFTDNPVNGHTLQLLYLTELRTALDETRGILGLPSQTYTPRAVNSLVGSAEITELRAAVK